MIRCNHCGGSVVKDITLEDLPNKHFCKIECANLAYRNFLKYKKIKDGTMNKTRTFIFPENHSKYVYSVVSNFDRKLGKGKTFVNQFYMMSHYIKSDEISPREFTDEKQQAEYHQQLANHYMELVNKVKQ